jgi:flagellar hook-associated protein 2
VTLDLKQQSAAPVTVTIGQDASKPLAAMKDFVTALNDVQEFVKASLGYDADGQAGPLKGNLGVRMLSDTLRRLATEMVSGLTGPYKSLSDLGVNTGAVGAAVGTTNSFKVDEAKFTAALSANPQAVYDVLNNGVVGSEGVFTRMRTYLTTATLPGGTLQAADDSATARNTDLARQIQRLQSQLAR